MTTQSFSIGAILTVTTGVICVDDFHDMRELLAFMCGESPATVQLLRFAEEVEPYLCEQLPWLKRIKPQHLVGDDWKRRVAKYAKRHGEFHELRPIHPEDHKRLHPREDLRRIMPDRTFTEITIDTTPDEPNPYGDINWKVE